MKKFIFENLHFLIDLLSFLKHYIFHFIDSEHIQERFGAFIRKIANILMLKFTNFFFINFLHSFPMLKTKFDQFFLSLQIQKVILFDFVGYRYKQIPKDNFLVIFLQFYQ